jgi:hypothetical protein
MATRSSRVASAVARRLGLARSARGGAALLLLGLCALAGPRPALAQEGQADLRARIRALDGSDLAQRDEALAALARAGANGARAVLEGFGTASAAGRALRARVVREHGGVDSLDGALAHCADPSPAVREEFAAFLGRALREHPRPPAALAERALAALVALARGAVDNVGAVGLPRALTGPAARGDVAVVAGHLAALPPAAREAYRALLRATIPLSVARGGLSPEAAQTLTRLAAGA